MSDELSQATAADFKADSLDGVDDAPSFPVSDEELLMIGAELATEYPDLMEPVHRVRPLNVREGILDGSVMIYKVQ